MQLLLEGGSSLGCAPLEDVLVAQISSQEVLLSGGKRGLSSCLLSPLPLPDPTPR